MAKRAAKEATGSTQIAAPVIRRLVISNYRRFKHLSLEFGAGINVLVGPNDCGKSTILEAIQLALTGRLGARSFQQALTPHIVNRAATDEYRAGLTSGAKRASLPPTVSVELHLSESPETVLLRGSNNSTGENACGVLIQARFDPEFDREYSSFLEDGSGLHDVPTEYYRVDWTSFAGESITRRSVPAVASVIDATALSLQSGMDHYLQAILREALEPKERVQLAREYRSVREEFNRRKPVEEINGRLTSEQDSLSDGVLSLGLDFSHRSSWESGVSPYLSDVPFALLGKGEQNALKTLLALRQRAGDAHVVLLEEPEAHLSFPSLRKLLGRVEDRCKGKQIVVTTHSTFVLNKIGLQSIIVLGDGGQQTRITDLAPDTIDFFKKLPGFDTLRLALAREVILVEGPSDELIVQRAYQDAHGHLPIEDGIDVLSVATSHKRFLDLAIPLRRRSRVVTDNDGKSPAEMRARFAEYTKHTFITLHTGRDPKLRTLEPQVADVNRLEDLNTLFGTKHSTQEALVEWMSRNKTQWSLAVFESNTRIEMPEYVKDAVAR